eukprot:9342518-Karenia_brevis.AAC.1
MLARGHAPAFHFHYDNSTAGGVAFELWNLKLPMRTADFVVALSLRLRAVARLDYSHVHSHVGHPWNHVADRICEQVAQDGS